MDVVLLILAVLWAAFAWWSWRWQRRHPLLTSVAAFQPLPWLGMGRWGLLMWVLLSLTQAARSVEMDVFHAFGVGRFYGELAVNLMVMYPLCLWGDFLYRRGMARSFGVRDESAPPAPPAA
ncbi:MAG TPA: hypothetical protein VFS20_21425 [Longimicrobium sp.]|nr:hypothetical protein [Longimicrobium sp.]